MKYTAIGLIASLGLTAPSLVACSSSSSTSVASPDAGGDAPVGQGDTGGGHREAGHPPDAKPDAVHDAGHVDATEPDATITEGGGPDAGRDAFVDASGDAFFEDTGTDAVAFDAGDAGATDGGDAGDGGKVALANVLYLETNDPAGNAILGYARAADGTLTPLSGSPYLTNGEGVSNPTQGLGPDDSDQEVIVSADHTHLFAVNAGSNTIAAFDIQSDGSLQAVEGSPFPSGGIDPSSLGLAHGDTQLFVVNKDGDPLQDAAAGAPNYTGFTVSAAGVLTPIANSTVLAGASPSQAYVAPGGDLLFGLDFMAALQPTNPAGPLRAFSIGAGGLLTAAPGTPMYLPVVDGGTPPGTQAALGLWAHPTQKILYVGFVLRNELGVYTYDGTSGALTYVTDAPLSGKAICWVRVSPDGNHIYATDTADDSVSVLDATEPLAPVETQNLKLADNGGANDAGATASEAYQEEVSPDGRFLYVISQRTSTDPAVTAGDYVHILAVSADGSSVAENATPLAIPVTAPVRAQGLVVF